MQHVFRHARPVIIWLGEATADSNLALTFVRQIHGRYLSHTRQRFENEKMEDYPKVPEIKAKLRCFMKPKCTSSWVALHSLFNRPWWSRAWIIQELLMAKQLQLFCGKKSSSWHIISVVIYVAMQIGPLSTKLLSKVPPVIGVVDPYTENTPHK
jgi:hypothetical protein